MSKQIQHHIIRKSNLGFSMKNFKVKRNTNTYPQSRYLMEYTK
jgi:hypothetical protein